MGSKGFTADDVPDQAGKCFVVTGANSGIGLETARVLAKRGARVLLACRDSAKAEAAMASIRAEAPQADLAFLPLDQADIESIRAAAALAAKEPRIDALINNAGVTVPTRQTTRQGFELQFGVNHLGSFALTALMLPKLRETPESRIVITSSGQHKGAKIDWDDLNAEKSFSGIPRYGVSKLANLLFLFELNRRLQAAEVPITVTACHPGLAGTNFGRASMAGRIVLGLGGVFLNTPAMGAWSTLQAATGNVKPGGYYGPTAFFELRGPSHECVPSNEARDPQLARRLWDTSVAMTGIDPGLAPADTATP
ncbi:NAD(P)-dependent dehydrogenase (short-subunit alcohol dehydrogenase family) [Sinorhizobium terangae]|uniref:SDR family NAD(P)-dependent oxidoreductase n=1 Tax=Sinorhizobium terangae TaxID=110322 RepID=A0A6N7LLN9_SINTE|nr:oxidoreductase [Sinorhizobium terangae]MBB4188541.1 NAD(P)-dependent dehydrogenase (short-subunit alcohol dehydrogenase family) [Sinorhizobium terangae]MQX18149.1 SDR family NAD(P)-dependent oxidoreductase [Sinorhizobium terangae]